MKEKLAFSDTGFFTKTVENYMAQAPSIQPFFEHSLSWSGLKNAIDNRLAFPQNRKVLVEELTKQYAGITMTDAVKNNIQALANSSTFTFTAAHQPNIFTGPLYMMYKIMHVIKLACEAKKRFPEFQFVPVYYMGSEDADLEELGHFTVQGKKYVWNTDQKGAVGRMLVDKSLIQLTQELKQQIAVEPFGEKLISIFEAAYTIGKSIQQATLEIMNTLFGRYGLVVLIPDNANLKKLFESVVLKEIKEGFSHPIVEQTAEALEKAGYKQQATGREINLFYLIDNHRERITKENNIFQIAALELAFTEEELIAEVKTHPERFSGNVILRGTFQETILPNICFVGGGGEIAYWLELKKVFQAVNIPYPLLLPRNSFMLMNYLEKKAFDQLQLNIIDLFQPDFKILDILAEKNHGEKINLTAQREKLAALFADIKGNATKAAQSLGEHTEAILSMTDKKLVKLEKKIKRAERQKQTIEIARINYLKQHLFPNGSLQERVENLALIYPKLGSQFLELLLDNSPDIPSEFVCLSY